MTAHKPAKSFPAKKIAKKQDPEQPDDGWPAVVRFALEDWPRTVRLCTIVFVVGVLVLLAMRLGLRLWL